MTESDTLHIAEVPFESGGVRFRYSRRMSADGTQWIRHGRFVAYHESGAIASEGEYVDGKEEGPWRDYHDNGQIAAQGRYGAGKQDGVWRFFDTRGREERSATYHDGRKV
jgi:antitoxin component YwqK of YwqJK toxin-antitoxin module